jgi:hypothetical protein
LHNRQKVHFVAVSSQLDSIGQSARNLIKKCFGRFGVAIPNQPTQDQLAIGVDCYERPSVTSETARGNRGRDVLVLCSHEGPKLVDLNAFGLQVYQRAVQVVRASRAKLQRELLNRVLGAPGHAGRGAYRIALNQGGYDLSPLGAV